MARKTKEPKSGNTKPDAADSKPTSATNKGADSKKYRTKFYLRSVTVDSDKITARVEPVSPYLFRIREKEYYGILKQYVTGKSQDNVLEAILIKLSKIKLSSGDESQCFGFQYKPADSNTLEVALLGKSADSIVEIEVEEITTAGSGTSKKCGGLQFKGIKSDATSEEEELTDLDGIFKSMFALKTVRIGR